jgi:hypothetical protein
MTVRLEVVYDLGENDPGFYCCEFSVQGLLEEIGQHNRS